MENKKQQELAAKIYTQCVGTDNHKSLARQNFADFSLDYGLPLAYNAIT